MGCLSDAHRAALVPRQPHWERRLVEWMEAQVGQPYVWGETDCVSLACRAIEVMTAIPLAKPAYTTALQGVGALRRAQSEHGSVGGWFVAQGLVQIDSVRLAHGGDLVVVEPLEARDLPTVAVIVATSVLLPDPVAGVVTTVPLATLAARAGVVLYRLPG
jgi:hypothetical protein